MKYVILSFCLFFSVSSFALLVSEEDIKKIIIEEHTQKNEYRNNGASDFSLALDRVNNPVKPEDIEFIDFHVSTHYTSVYNPLIIVWDGIENLIKDTEHDYDVIEAEIRISEKKYLYKCECIETSVSPNPKSLNTNDYYTNFRTCHLKDLDTNNRIKLKMDCSVIHSEKQHEPSMNFFHIPLRPTSFGEYFGPIKNYKPTYLFQAFVPK